MGWRIMYLTLFVLKSFESAKYCKYKAHTFQPLSFDNLDKTKGKFSNENDGQRDTIDTPRLYEHQLKLERNYDDNLKQDDPDCPKDMKYQETESERSTKNKFSQYEKSLQDPPYLRASYQNLYRQSEPLVYGNSYNDKTYGRYGYLLPVAPPARHFANELSTRSLKKLNVFDNYGRYTTDPHVNALYDSRYGTKHDNSPNFDSVPSYQTRTTYLPKSNDQDLLKAHDTRFHSHPMYHWQDAKAKERYQQFQKSNHKSRMASEPVYHEPAKSFQTYDMKAIKTYNDVGTYPNMPVLKELKDGYMVGYNNNPRYSLPYVVPASQYWTTRIYDPYRYHVRELTTGKVGQKTILNDEFKTSATTALSSHLENPYGIKAVASGHKKEYVPSVRWIPKLISPSRVALPKTAKVTTKERQDEDQPIGPKTRNPFAFGKYTNRKRLLLLFVFFFPSTSFNYIIFMYILCSIK